MLDQHIDTSNMLYVQEFFDILLYISTT